MPFRRKVKANAKRALKGSWGKAICIVIIVAVIITIFSLVEVLFYALLDLGVYVDPSNTKGNHFDDVLNISPLALAITLGVCVVAFLILSPVAVGVKRWFYRVVEGERQPISMIFDDFGPVSRFFRAVGLWINLGVRIGLIALAVNLPLVAIRVVARLFNLVDFVDLNEAGLALLFLSAVLFLLGGLLTLFIAMRYFLVPYLYIDRPDLTQRQIFRISAACMRNRKEEVFWLFLSFIPWLLSCLLILPALFVAPYLMASEALYAKVFVETAKLEHPDLFPAERCASAYGHIGGEPSGIHPLSSQDSGRPLEPTQEIPDLSQEVDRMKDHPAADAGKEQQS